MSKLPTWGYGRNQLEPTAGYGVNVRDITQPPTTSDLDVDSCVSCPLGVVVQGFGTMKVNGAEVFNQVTIPEEGYFEDENFDSTCYRKTHVHTVDPIGLKVAIEDVVAAGSAGKSYRGLVDQLPRPYSGSVGGRPHTSSAQVQLVVTTNKSVSLRVRQRQDDGTFIEVGKVCAHGPGRWVSSELPLGRGLNDLKLVLVLTDPLFIIAPLSVGVTAPASLGVPDVSPVILSPVGLLTADDQEFMTSNPYAATPWTAVATADDDTSRNIIPHGSSLVSFKFGNYTPSMTMQYLYSVQFRARVSDRFGSNKSRWAPYLLRTADGQRSYLNWTTTVAAGSAYTTYNFELLKNPFTGLAWTTGDLQGDNIHWGIARDQSLDELYITLMNVLVNEVLLS